MKVRSTLFDVIYLSLSNISVECCVTEEFLSKVEYPPAENLSEVVGTNWAHKILRRWDCNSWWFKVRFHCRNLFQETKFFFTLVSSSETRAKLDNLGRNICKSCSDRGGKKLMGFELWMQNIFHRFSQHIPAFCFSHPSLTSLQLI